MSWKITNEPERITCYSQLRKGDLISWDGHGKERYGVVQHIHETADVSCCWEDTMERAIRNKDRETCKLGLTASQTIILRYPQ